MKKQHWQAAAAGTAAGFINGLFGAGGGMILVPILQRVLHLEDRQCFPTALCIMLPISLVSIWVYAKTDGIDLRAALPYLVTGLIGGLIGGALYRKVPTKLLHKALGLLILWGGIRLLLP